MGRGVRASFVFVYAESIQPVWYILIVVVNFWSLRLVAILVVIMCSHLYLLHSINL